MEGPEHIESGETLNARNLVYFGHMPGQGTGSPIIVYRHLKRFAAQGWRVHVVADWGQDDAVCREHGWPVRTLSHRKPYWPPFSPDNAVSRRVRTHLWAGEIREWLGESPKAVLTYLSAFSDTLSLAAVGFSRRYGVPLTTIHHDDARCFIEDAEESQRAHDRHQWVLRHSSWSLFASPSLASCFNVNPDKVLVLAPIPEGREKSAQWSPARGGNVRIYYAGAIWPVQFPLLSKIAHALDSVGARLVLLSRETTALRDFVNREPVDWMAPFPSNHEALDHLADHASGLLVSYSETMEEMPWTATSFPSKFIEFSHLDVPCAIVAHRESAIARWAKEASFPDVFFPDQLEAFTRWAGTLRSKEGWHAAARSLQVHARGAFDPGSIHRQLEKCLLG